MKSYCLVCKKNTDNVNLVKNKYGKEITNKGITAAKRFNKSKYGNTLKKEGLKFTKTSGK